MNEVHECIKRYKLMFDQSTDYLKSLNENFSDVQISGKLRLAFIKDIGFKFDNNSNLSKENLKIFTNELFDGYTEEQVYALRAIISFNWITNYQSENYDIQFKKFIDVIYKSQELKTEITIKVENENIEIDLNAGGADMIGELYNKLLNIVRSNEEDRETIDLVQKELVSLKEWISKLNDKTLILEKDMVENDFQNIISKIIELIPGFGKIITTIYLANKTGKKLIGKTKEIKINLD